MATYNTLRDDAHNTSAGSYTFGGWVGLTVGDQAVAFIFVAGKTAHGTLTQTSSTWTLVDYAVSGSSIMECWVRDNHLTATSTGALTYTVAAGGNAGGADAEVLFISGLNRAGVAAVVQSAKQENQTSGTPAPTFSSAVKTFNFTAGAVLDATNSGNSITEPSGWTEILDFGLLSTPGLGFEVVVRNSGFTGTTVTWGSAAPSAFSSFVVELDNTNTVSTGLTADAVIKANIAKTFTADAVIKRLGTSGSFTADATIAIHAVHADAVIQRTTSPSLTADAVLLGLRNRHFRDRDHFGTLGDNEIELFSAIGRYPAGTSLSTVLVDLSNRLAAARKQSLKTFSADAVIFKSGTIGHTLAYALINASGISKTFTADAVISNGHFTANADLKKTLSGAFLADALVGGKGYFRADAALKKTTSRTFTANAKVSLT